MKSLFLISYYILGVIVSCVAQSKTEDDLYGLLKNGKYKDLVNKVCSLREKEYYKNAFMDYCLAYGYCQLNEPAISGEWFDHILASYNNLSNAKRGELKELKQSCTNKQIAAYPTEALFAFLKGMSTDGFEGNNAGVESKMGIPSLTDTVEEFDFEHMTFDSRNRKFSQQQKKDALLYYKDILAEPAMQVDTTSHFLVFYPKNALNIKSQLIQLEKYYSFYKVNFNLQESNRLITVFYCTNRSDFEKVATRVHNLPVPQSTYGYASSIDLVMLGIANSFWLGAMKHELFHLMIRSYVGDIPPWLDEGTACYFESSKLRMDVASTNLSGSNYRIKLLRNRDMVIRELNDSDNKAFKMPSINELINYNWQEFSGKQGDLMINASYNQSLSYAFVSFLSNYGFLTKTIEVFRNRAYLDTTLTNGNDGLTILRLRTNGELLTKVTGLSMERMQIEFDNWCMAKFICRY